MERVPSRKKREKKSTHILRRLSYRLYIASRKILDRCPSREFSPAHGDGRDARPTSAAAAAAAGQRPLTTRVDIRTSPDGDPVERASTWAGVLWLQWAVRHGPRATTDSATADERVVGDAGRAIYG